jgi:hypothetical protein
MKEFVMRKNILIAMNKNAVQWSCVLLVGIIILIGIFLRFPIGPYYDPYWDFRAISHSAFLNMVAFVIGYSILRPLKSLVFWKFIVYVVVITTINWYIFCMRRYDWSLPLVGGQYSWFFLTVFPYIFAILLNIGFLKYLFGIETKNAILMGILLGITNAHAMIVNLPIKSFDSNTIILPK